MHRLITVRKPKYFTLNFYIEETIKHYIPIVLIALATGVFFVIRECNKVRDNKAVRKANTYAIIRHNK